MEHVKYLLQLTNCYPAGTLAVDRNSGTAYRVVDLPHHLTGLEYWPNGGAAQVLPAGPSWDQPPHHPVTVVYVPQEDEHSA